MAEGLILKGSVGWNPDSTQVNGKKTQTKQGLLKSERLGSPENPVPSFHQPAGFLIEDGRRAVICEIRFFSIPLPWKVQIKMQLYTPPSVMVLDKKQAETWSSI